MRPSITKRIASVLCVALLSCPAFSQEATLTTPVTHASEAKYKIRAFTVLNPVGGSVAATVELSSQDSSNNEITTLTYTVPGCGTSTISGLAGAMNVARSGETGAEARKQAFRILGYLKDVNCLPANTLVP